MKRHIEYFNNTHTTYTYYIYAIKYEGVIKYVGKTEDYKTRMQSHYNFPGSTKSGIPLGVDMDEIEFELLAVTKNNYIALFIESQLMIEFDTINNGCNKRVSIHTIA